MSGDPGWKQAIWHLYLVAPAWLWVFEELAQKGAGVGDVSLFPQLPKFQSSPSAFLSWAQRPGPLRFKSPEQPSSRAREDRCLKMPVLLPGGGHLGRQLLLPPTFHQSFQGAFCPRNLRATEFGAHAACHRSAKKQRQGLDYNCSLINIRGQQSEKVEGKTPHIHLPLSFPKQVYIGETWGFGIQDLGGGDS